MPKKKKVAAPKMAAKAPMKRRRRAATPMVAPPAAPAAMPAAPRGPMGPPAGAGMGMASPPAFKKGGKVKKTGMALVHKGEKVLTKAQQKKGKY